MQQSVMETFGDRILFQSRSEKFGDDFSEMPFQTKSSSSTNKTSQRENGQNREPCWNMHVEYSLNSCVESFVFSAALLFPG